MTLRPFVLATLTLLGAWPGVALAQSRATIEQVSSNNRVDLMQDASAALQSSAVNQATIVQMDGGDHVVLLTQSGGARADVTQFGSGNRLAGVGLASLGDDLAAAVQTFGATLELMQSGTLNTAYVQQAGGFASITQDGTGNTATIIQNGF